MRKIIVLFLSASLWSNSYSQWMYNPASSCYLDAVAYTPKFIRSFSCAANPATLPYLKNLSLGFYMEKKYMTEGLNLAEVSLAYGRGAGGAGIVIKYFGNPFYNEVHASVNYGKSLGDLSLGTSLQYNVYSIQGFNKQIVLSMAFSSIWKLSDKLYTEMQVINPAFTRLGNKTFGQIAEYRLGFGFEVSSAVSLSMELKKPEDIPLQVNTSFQYRFAENLIGKAGIFTGGPQPFLSIGWQLKDFYIEAAITSHPALGATPGVLFNYQKTGEEVRR